MSDPKEAVRSGPILVEAIAPGEYGGRTWAAGDQFTIANEKAFSNADRETDDGSGKTGLPILKGWMRRVDPKSPRAAVTPLTQEQRLARLEQSQLALAKDNEALRAENARLKAEAAGKGTSSPPAGGAGKPAGKDTGKS